MRSKRTERKPEQAALVAHLGDEDPFVPLLGQQTDIQASRPVGDDVGHVGQLSV